MKIKNFNRATASGLKGQFSGYMLLAVAVTVLVCAQVTYSQSNNRKLPQGHLSIDNDIQIVASDIAEMDSIAELPQVSESWAKLNASAGIHGYSVSPAEASDTEDGTQYHGPLKSWSGVLTGKTEVVLLAIRKLQRSIPVFLYSYKIDGNEATINISVVGT